MIEKLIEIARDASNVLRVRAQSDFAVEYKGVDDPVTIIDREINTMLLTALAKEFPSIPIVSEEADPATWEARKTAREVFFVDPVDGTRELIDRNGMFCVMIGLAREGRPVAGVVAWPSEERIFAAWEGNAFSIEKDGTRAPLRIVDVDDPRKARVLVSRSHFDPGTKALLDRAGMTPTPYGSTGLKVALVACGNAQAYVHIVTRGSGKLWDACGPEAIARGAGAMFTDASGRTLDYRGELALSGGLFVATPNVHRALMNAI